MRCRFFIVLVEVVLVAALATSSACNHSGAATGASGGPDSGSASHFSNDTNLGASSSPIINGTVDNIDTAVVAIISTSSTGATLCSGTIIKVDPNNHIGWVLTAAHCIVPAPTVVLQGTDYSASDAIRYYVIDYGADPRYELGGNPSQPFDVAVLRIGGVDKATPVMPIASRDDGLDIGSEVKAVGFGRTTLLEAGTDTNTNRMTTPLVVADITSLQIGYDLTERGICEGDSGGPDLVTQNGLSTVVGIHSFIAGDCNGKGASTRVSGNLDFIEAELTMPLPDRTCSACAAIAMSGNQECAQITTACLANPDCAAFYTCPGATTNADDRAACMQKYPAAQGPVTAASECPCNRSCADVCASQPVCAGVPACGETLPADACGSCMQNTCCQKVLDCQADSTCHLCLTEGDKDPSCQSNGARRALAACAIPSCNAPCLGTEFVRDVDSIAPNTRGSSSVGCSVERPDATGASALASAMAVLSLAVQFIRRRRRCRHERSLLH
ncbi:MAG: S1 family peptidase [Polyangiaceae bacterium]|nr:S1 family peptidase [Polyangiaceae bacterium]